MPKTKQKHYHVSFNQKLYNRHEEIKTRIQALGMVFKGSVGPAIQDITGASQLFRIDPAVQSDVTETELTGYIHAMNNIIATVYEFVPQSDLRKLVETLKQDAVKHITGDPHDPHLDVPGEDAFAKARSILFPGGESDSRVPAKQMHSDVLFRLAKYLESQPIKQGIRK